MEISKNDMKMLKGVAILFMLLLHLFGRKEIDGLYVTFLSVNDVPLLYYLALFGDACVPIFCFASGYGLFVSFQQTQKVSIRKNFKRIFKFLINYWIILFLFVTIGFLLGHNEIPGDLSKFLANFFVLSNSYNGAWWFVQTYIILVLLTPFLFKVINKYNSIWVLIITGIIYLLSYIQRIKFVLDFGDNTFLFFLVEKIVLVGTSLLPFVVGAIFVKEKVYTKIYNEINHVRSKNIICSIGILLLVIGHAFYESMIIAPFTAIGFICFFNLMDKNIQIKKLLSFFGNHSTNMWLTHMFFYMIFFPGVTFAPKYPILIFAWLIILCLVASYVINFINKPMNRLIDKLPSKIYARNIARNI